MLCLITMSSGVIMNQFYNPSILRCFSLFVLLYHTLSPKCLVVKGFLELSHSTRDGNTGQQ